MASTHLNAHGCGFQGSGEMRRLLDNRISPYTYFDDLSINTITELITHIVPLLRVPSLHSSLKIHTTENCYLEAATSNRDYDVSMQPGKVMTTYNIQLNEDTLQINFGEPAQNHQIVKDAAARLEEMASGELRGGPLLKINGSVSIPVAFVLAHRLSHLYGAIGCFDPKLGKYVICVTHNPEYKVGDLID